MDNFFSNDMLDGSTPHFFSPVANVRYGVAIAASKQAIFDRDDIRLMFWAGNIANGPATAASCSELFSKMRLEIWRKARFSGHWNRVAALEPEGTRCGVNVRIDLAPHECETLAEVDNLSDLFAQKHNPFPLRPGNYLLMIRPVNDAFLPPRTDTDGLNIRLSHTPHRQN